MLQQPTAFRPFVREFILFAQVAYRTCEHNVANVIGAATSNRDYMLSVILGQLLMAVVALALLPLVLLLDILSGMVPTIALYTSAAFMPITSVLFFMGLIISMKVFAFCFTVSLAISAVIVFLLLFMGLHPSVAFRSKSFTTFSLTRVSLLSVISAFASFDFFKMSKTIGTAFSFYLFLIAFIKRSALCSTRLTVLSTIGAFIRILTGSASTPTVRKVFTGGRVFIATIITAFLGYTCLHSKGHSLLSRSGVFSAPPERNNLYPYYSINRLLKPLYSMKGV